MVRALLNARAWRIAGRSEYRRISEALRAARAQSTLRKIFGALGVSFLPLALVADNVPFGPDTPLKSVFYFAAAIGGALLGVRWWFGPWPTVTEALWFLMLSDVFFTVAAVVMSGPYVRITGTLHLGMMGLFAAFFLGWRILLMHCAYSLALIVSLVVVAVVHDGIAPAALFIVLSPVIATVVGVPVAAQFAIEVGRRGFVTLANESSIDPLTKLLNRRGMRLAMRRAVATRPRIGAVLVMAAVDLDEFKSFNDTHGHIVGDELLVAVAARLRANVPESHAARWGGDEFGIFAIRDGLAQAQVLVDRLCSLMAPRLDPDGAGIRGSMGIVVVPAETWSDRLEELPGRADAVMYRAKRDPTESVAVDDATAEV